MGDPADIGPEIVIKALRDPDIYAGVRPLVFREIPDAITREGINVYGVG